MTKKKLIVSLFGLLMILLFGGVASGFTVLINGVNKNFLYKRSVTIQADQVQGTGHANFPMLFDSNAYDLKDDFKQSAGKVQSADGYDIVFATGDGVEILKHEIEKWVYSSGEYLAWIKIPTLSGDSNTTIYMYYYSEDVSSDTQHVTDVWDDNYRAVWHLSETTGGIAVDAVSTGTGTDSTITVSHTTGAGANRLMLVGISIGANVTVSSVTYGGTALTLVIYQPGYYSDEKSYIYQLVAPVSGAADVVVTLSSSAGTVVGVMTFTGVNQTTPLGTPAGNTGSGSLVTVDISSGANELVFDTLMVYPRTLTVGAGQTERWDITDTNCKGAASTEPGAATVTMSWTLGSSTSWGTCGVSIKPAIPDPIKDSTQYGNHGTDGGSPGLGVDGKIGKAVEFSGGAEYIDCGESDLGLTGKDELTLEVWFVRHTAGGWHDRILVRGQYSNPFDIRSADDTYMRQYFKMTGEEPGEEGGYFDITGFDEHDTNWYYYAARVKVGVGDDWWVYENGIEVGSGVISGTFNMGSGSQPVVIGAQPVVLDDNWDGLIDEVRVSNIARSENWIKTCYNNQGSPSTFYSMGIEQAAVLDHFTFDTISSPQTAGTAFSLTITAKDAGGNTVTTYTGTNTLSDTTETISPSSTGAFTSGTWTGDVTITAAQTGVTITTTRSGGAETGTSNSFTVNPGSLANFLVEAEGGGDIGTQTAGTAFTIKITARDSNNNTVTSFTGTVDITSTGNLSAGSGTTAAFTAGVLASHSVNISNTGSFTITATRTGGAETGASNEFAVNAGALASFEVDAPASGTAGTGFSVTVTTKDSEGNTTTDVSGATALSVDEGTVSPTSIAQGQFTDDGVWTGNVILTKAGSRTITATNDSKTGSDTIEISAGAASKLAFDQQPTNTVAGANISSAVTVKILDENDNLVNTATDDVSLAIENNPGSGTLSGTTSRAAVNGIATFNDLSIDKAGEGYTLKASSGSATASITEEANRGIQSTIILINDISKDKGVEGSALKAGTAALTEAISDAFNITAGTVNKLVFTVYPSAVVAGAWSSKYTVQRQDEHGNPVTAGETTVEPSSTSDGANKEFSLTQSSPPPPPGGGEFTVTIQNGASSADFYYYDEKAGQWTISAAASGLEGDSKSLTVNTGEAANISKVSGDNQSGSVGATLSNYFVVKVTDAYGNSISGKTVNWSITQTPSGATGQSLSATSTTTDSDGEAKSKLTLGDKAGEYKVQATSNSLSGSPITFTTTANTGEAENISKVSGDCQSGDVITDLTYPFVVKVTDDDGNGVSGVTVSWSITTAPVDATGQILSATSTTTDSDGEAESTLTLGDKAGLYKVEASCSGLSGTPIKFTATTGKSYFIKGGCYHKFSIPYQLNNGNAEVVLDELGPYDRTKWRLYRYEGQYQEYPNITNFSPGLGYWLISAEDNEIFVEGDNVSSDVTVTLEPGWNQIGCPFVCSVSWDSIKNENSSLFDNNIVADVLWGYDSENREYVLCNEMSPWQGYWVLNNSESSINLIIPYQ